MNNGLPFLFNRLSVGNKRKIINNLKETLSRDIENLLNEAAHSAQLNLKEYDYIENSVLNYGFPSLSKKMPINVDPITLANHITKILVAFEPRLDPNSIKVIPLIDNEDRQILSILFDIYANLLIDQENIAFDVNLRIALDYSCGNVHVL